MLAARWPLLCLLGALPPYVKQFVEGGVIWRETGWFPGKEGKKGNHQSFTASGIPFLCQCRSPLLQWQCLFLTLGWFLGECLYSA